MEEDIPMRPTFYSRFGKRAIDLACATFGLILLSPVMLLVALAVRLSSPGPALFRQLRVGQFGKPFTIFKFRSMVGKAQGPGALLTAQGDPRITKVGRWLRATKLDELPQLFNVALGDMSLIGPRPEVPFYVARYDERQKSVLTQKPGMSGISANLREEELLAAEPDKEDFYISKIMPAKLELDIAYCRNVCFATDAKLLLGTIYSVFRRVLELYASPRFAIREKT